MANPVLARQYQRVLSRFPADVLRPNVSFQETMQKRAEQRFTLRITTAPTVKSTATESHGFNTSPSDKDELEQLNALCSLVENRYSEKYKLSESFMKPRSKPNHYTDLINELEEAPQRSWLGRKIHGWKGALRLA